MDRSEEPFYVPNSPRDDPREPTDHPQEPMHRPEEPTDHSQERSDHSGRQPTVRRRPWVIQRSRQTVRDHPGPFRGSYGGLEG